MQRVSESGKNVSRRHRRGGLLCALGLIWLLAAGCQSPPTTSTSSTDPLFGEKQPEKAPGVTGPTPPPQNRAGMGSPASPPATASKSNAAMVIGADPLLGGKTIAIADTPPPNLPTNNWQPAGPASPAGGSNGPGVNLRAPDAGQGATTAPPPFNPQGASMQGAPVPVYSQVNQVGFNAPAPAAADPLDALKQRGMIWKNQKPVDGGVLLTCGIRSNPQDPDLVRVYEATAVDVPSAVKAVADQIDKAAKQ